jgi:hypothetical protein
LTSLKRTGGVEYIDAYIKAIVLHVIKLHKARNSLLPIARLPTIIMEEIFGYVMHSFSDSTIISSVCLHWCTICLNASSLWSSIKGQLSLKQVELYLSRSRGRLLKVDIHIPSTKMVAPYVLSLKAAIKILLVNIGRIQFLSISAPQQFLRPFYSSQPEPVSAPFLQLLEISVTGISDATTLPTSDVLS